MSSPRVQLSKLSLQHLTEIYNAVQARMGRPGVELLTDGKVAWKRVDMALRQAGMAVVRAPHHPYFAVLKRRVRYLEGDDRIVVKRIFNPHPVQTDMAKFWDMLISGETIGQYVQRRGDPERARKDVMWWNRKHDWIALIDYVEET